MNPISRPEDVQIKHVKICQHPNVRAIIVPNTDEIREIVRSFTVYQRKMPKKGLARVLAGKDGTSQYEQETFNMASEMPRQIVLPLGFRYRIDQLLRAAGYTTEFVRLKAERPFPPKEGWQIPNWDCLRSRFDSFRYRQEEMLTAITKWPFGKIDFTTGGGKTTMMKYLPCLYPLARFVITAEASVVESTIYPAVASIPDVGVFTSKASRNRDARILCVSAGCLHHVDPGKVDFLLVDEADQAVTDVFSKSLMAFGRARMYGFSGSFSLRDDGLALREEALFGRTIFTMKTKEALDRKMVVKVYVLWREVICEDPAEDVKDDVIFNRKAFWTNDYRNQMIAKDALYQNFYQKTPVMIVCQSVEHQYELLWRIPEARVYHADGALDRVVANTDEATLREILRERGKHTEEMLNPKKQALRLAMNDFRNSVPGIYIMPAKSGRGLNVENLPLVINASAISSKSFCTQLSGRPCRLFPDKNYGLVIDYRDDFNKRARFRAIKREKAFALAGRTNVQPPRYAKKGGPRVYNRTNTSQR